MRISRYRAAVRELLGRAAGGKAHLWLLLLILWSLPATASAACRITVLGDSLTAGYGLPLEAAFPAQLERALQERGYACGVANAGVSGDTSAGGLARLDWVLAEEPTHLILELGANDALRALPVDQLEANLAAIVERAQARGIRVMLAGMLAPPNLGPGYADAFRAVYERLADRYGVPLYPFFLDGVVQRPEFLQRDGLHPTAEGVAEIVRRIVPTVTAWLEATGVTARAGAPR
jgi:acyl-CoA thioesterase-1